MGNQKKNSAERRDFRQSGVIDDSVPHRRRRGVEKKPFVLEGKRDKDELSFFWECKWTTMGRYRTRQSAEQAMKAHKRDQYWGTFEYRIVEK